MNSNLSVIKEKLSKHLAILSKRYQVKSLSVFGSYVRQQQSGESYLVMKDTLKQKIAKRTLDEVVQICSHARQIVFREMLSK